MKNKIQLALSIVGVIVLVVLIFLPEDAISFEKMSARSIEPHEKGTVETLEETLSPQDKMDARGIKILGKQNHGKDNDNFIPETGLDTSFEFVLQQGHSNSIEDLAIDPFGRYLISYGEYGRIKIWNIETGQVLRNYLHSRREPDGYNLLAVDPKGEYFITGANDGNIMVWSVPSNRLIKTIHRKNSRVSGVAIAPSGLIWVSYFTTGIDIYDINKDAPLIKINDRWMSKMVLSPKGEFLITASGGKFFKRDPRTGNVLKSGELRNRITAITISPSGKRFAVGCTNGEIHVIDANTFTVLQTCKINHSSRNVRCLLISPDDEKLISGFHDIYVWDIPTGKVLHTMKDAGYVLSSLVLDQKGKTLFSGANMGTIRMWDMESGAHIKDLCALPGSPDRMAEPVSNLIIDPQFKFMIAARRKEEISIWNLGSLKMVKSINVRNRSLHYRLDPKGRFLAINDHKKNQIELWDLATGATLTTLENNLRDFHTEWFDIHPNGEHIVSTHFKAGMQHATFIWSAETGRILSRIDKLYNVVIDPKGKYLAGTVVNGFTARIYDFPSAELRHEFIVPPDKTQLPNATKVYSDAYIYEKKHLPGEIYKLIPDPNGKYILAVYLSGRIDIINAETGGWIKNIEQPTGRFSSNDMEKILFDPAGNYFSYRNMISQKAYIWDVRTGKIACRIKGQCHHIFIHPNAPQAVSASNTGIEFWDLATGERKRTMEKCHGIKNLAVDKEWQYLIVNTEKENLAWNFRTGELKKNSDSKGPLYAMTIPDGKKTVKIPVIMETGPNDTIHLLDPLSGNEIDNPGLHFVNMFSNLYVHGNFVVSINKYNQLKIQNTKRKHAVALAHNGPEWIAYTPEGYFDSSRNGGTLVAMVKGLEGYGPDQFAIRNNRPDLILKNIGLGSESLIAHFNYQYQKRLRKSGFLEQQLSNDYHVPHAKIIDIQQKGKSIDVTFKLQDLKSSLKRYNIYVNDVPLFGEMGKNISGHEVTLTETLQLTQGNNKIEVTCINETGVEAYRALTHAAYDKKIKGDLYYVGFGVSDYKDSSLNLNYADKDVKDLETLFLQMKGAYQHVNTKTFINKAVTKTCTEEAKHFLKKASEDDTFILFIAGHGLHNNDKEATYYFLTHETLLKNLETNAIPYSAFESLLMEVAPRNKIFLMDTCESGDLSDSIQDTYFTRAKARGFSPRTTRAVILVKRKQRKNSTGIFLQDKDRYIYNDLFRRSGAIVFSSSKGNEFSYESEDVENGFFTEGIISAFTTKPSDKSKNRYLSIKDFRDSVEEYVARMSNDLQHPTIDRDNIYQKIQLPFVFAGLPHSDGTGIKSVGTVILPDQLHWYIGDLIRIYNGATIETGILKQVDEKYITIGERPEKPSSGLSIPKGNIYYIDIPDASTPISYGVNNQLKKDTDPSLPGLPLHDAARKGDITSVSQFLSKGAGINAKAFNGTTPLSFAVENGWLNIVKLMIDKGAEINTRNIDGLSPAYYAVRKGHVDILKYLIEKGADIAVINAYGETLLHNAVTQKGIDLAAVLLDNGFIIDTPDARGYSALHTAAAANRPEMAELLLQKGMDINIKGKNDGLTPLHVAAVNKSYEVTEFLLKNGADVNAKTPDGYTPLKYIKMPRHTRTIGGRSGSVDGLLKAYGGTE